MAATAEVYAFTDTKEYDENVEEYFSNPDFEEDYELSFD